MGWGFYRGYGRSYHSQPGKKATAASLSTATLQRIINEQKAQEEAQVRRIQLLSQHPQPGCPLPNGVSFC